MMQYLQNVWMMERAMLPFTSELFSAAIAGGCSWSFCFAESVLVEPFCAEDRIAILDFVI